MIYTPAGSFLAGVCTYKRSQKHNKLSDIEYSFPNDKYTINIYAQWGTNKNEQYNDYLFFMKG